MKCKFCGKDMEKDIFSYNCVTEGCPQCEKDKENQCDLFFLNMMDGL